MAFSDNLSTETPIDNLPNFVMDGTAPHLNYSPPKRKPQDWLTRLRIERNFRQEMMGPRSPKAPRLEMSPKSTVKTDTTTKSPLLRFFRVTSTKGPSADSIACSPKSRGGGLPNRSSGAPQN